MDIDRHRPRAFSLWSEPFPFQLFEPSGKQLGQLVLLLGHSPAPFEKGIPVEHPVALKSSMGGSPLYRWTAGRSSIHHVSPRSETGRNVHGGVVPLAIMSSNRPPRCFVAIPIAACEG